MNETFEVSNSTRGLPAESQYILIVLYTLTATLAVTGNLLVLVVFSFGRRSRTDLRPFLVNLAIADLVMAIFCMPFTFAYTMLHDWIFGVIMCPLVLFCQMFAVTASVGTSTAIAVDRYLVVAHPLQARNPKFRARCAVCLVWTIAGLFSSPQLFVGRSGTYVNKGMQRTGCAEAWPNNLMQRFFSFFVLTTTYLLPLSIIAMTYGLVAWRLWRHKTPGNADNARDKLQLIAKKKVIKMLITVVILFGVCWLPLHVFGLVIDFMPELNNEDQPEVSTTGAAVYTTVHWLAMSNSFVNPIIYGFLNDSFRNDLKWLLTRCCCSRWMHRRLRPTGRDHLSSCDRNSQPPQQVSASFYAADTNNGKNNCKAHRGSNPQHQHLSVKQQQLQQLRRISME